ncbi:MAG: DUF1956 domain-containing protein, partial [Planctomycetes bacterium]|nr:DUF1956 domain-containing protein [Planctomycetota bacterium]
LYAAVLKYAHRYAIESHPPDGGLPAGASADERLAAFVQSFLRRLTDKGRRAWHGLLMIREITEPTGALDELVEQSIRPQYELLCGIVRDLLGPDTDIKQIRLCASSIVGQCMHFQIAREVLRRLNPDLVHDPAAIETIARHIVEFSLAGIRCRRQPKGGGR